MNAAEVIWRLNQRHLVSCERKLFSQKTPVFEIDTYKRVPEANLSLLGINFNNDSYSFGSDIELLGDYSYSKYHKHWHAVFQNSSDWPVCYSPDYNFSAADVPGDIRTNWELNRHYQFAVLAKSYFVTRDAIYLAELNDLFLDWNKANPFMWGPEWTSPMEESIRLVNWLFAAAFLEASGDVKVQQLRSELCAGAWVMAAHVRKHYSRYSSANNHTIVEAAGVVVAASVFGKQDWVNEALELLEAEVALQTYPDGVNKEQALHYQLFVMEALCIVSHVLRAAGECFPETLIAQLQLMARYVRACCVGGGEYVEFGDNDDGIILSLGPCKPNYPEYVLALVSLEVGVGVRWDESVNCCETLNWLYSSEQIEAGSKMPLAVNKPVENFPDGGVAIVRSRNGRVVFAFDYGPIGFGQLAAHGHADALSFQMYIDGEPVFVDPGTYIYNGNQEMRSYFRSTCAHNTVCINDKNQSEMLGAFLWGRKANCKLLNFEQHEDGSVILIAEHDGYQPAIHRRTFEFDGEKTLTIKDEIYNDENAQGVASFVLAPNVKCVIDNQSVSITLNGKRVFLTFIGNNQCSLKCAKMHYSKAYGTLEETIMLVVKGLCSGAPLTTKITLK